MKMLAGRSRPGRARGAVLAWPRWERLANTRWPTQKIPETRYDVLRVRIAPYRFGSLTLPDGTRIIRGAPIGELHCNNDSPLAFVRLHGTPYPAARDDLRCLARWSSASNSEADVVAFHGLTLIAPAAARLGFSLREQPHSLRSFIACRWE